MKKTLFLLVLLACLADQLAAQQLYLEGFTGRNRTGYDLAPYSDSPKWYSPIGGRFAFGADHVQLGGEYHRNLINPTFGERDLLNNKSGESEFETTYYGAFLRAKICRYPTLRFGLVLRAGAGLYSMERKSTAPLLPKSTIFEQKFGFNGGVGMSIPLFRPVMVELGYTYNHVVYDGATGSIGETNGSYHSVQLGLSFNFVFGKRAADYRHLQENWKFRDGWRG